MKSSKQRLYQLLPEIFRTRDLQQGLPLEALMQVFNEVLDDIQSDIDLLYDDQFIETCRLAIVPYIGDLVGATVRDRDADLPTLRGYVGNLVGYRRRKGLSGVLERAAYDVTGYGVRVAEAYPALAGTQALNVLSVNGGTVNLRHTGALGRLGSPLDRLSRSAEIRLPRSNRPLGYQRGRFGADAFDVFLYRLAAYPLSLATPAARPLSGPAPAAGCFWFNPLGIDAPLFQVPVTPVQEFHTSGPGSVPCPLDHEWLGVLLNQGDPSETLRIFQVTTGSPPQLEEISPQDMGTWDLSGWDTTGFEKRVAIDPALGRFKIGDPAASMGEVRVCYAYGFSTEIGGGPYKRSVASKGSARLFLVGPYEDPPPGQAPQATGTSVHGSVEAALQAWKSWAAKNTGTAVIRIVDSRTYGWQTSVGTPAWVSLDVSGADLILEAESGQRPCITGDLLLSGSSGARVRFSGLLCGGRLAALGPLALHVTDTTWKPCSSLAALPLPNPPAGVPAGAALEVRIERSIVGAIRASRSGVTLAVSDSIIDASGEFNAMDPGDPPGSVDDRARLLVIGVSDRVFAIAGASGTTWGSAAPPCTVKRTTVFGEVVVAALEAEDALFAGRVVALSQTDGAASNSYFAERSVTPHLTECADWRQGPVFTSTRYGNPWYAQLDGDTPAALRRGASNGSEMGAFQRVRAALRERNLDGVLQDYLPLTFEPRIFNVT